ncbi:MAG TPA: FAD-dependent oxidoreductase, partial [Candidatus Limnocylindria bacterium]|nr:FAD-dependent oxidoreductase [Candidatus Limnocylindria bacterium]
MERHDVVIIGAGASGEAAAYEARRRGASVAIIDRALFGGSCPFWACMPSKALLHAAAVHHRGGNYPWPKASDFRDYMINREGTDAPDDAGHVRALEDAGATVIRGSATLAGPGRVRVRDREIEAEAIILAVGSVSRVPDDVAGLADASPWTNVQGTSTRELPRSLAILGAGPTGVELAQVYARYGVPVTLVHPRDRVHDREHRRSSELLGSALEREGVSLRLNVRAV